MCVRTYDVRISGCASVSCMHVMCSPVGHVCTCIMNGGVVAYRMQMPPPLHPSLQAALVRTDAYLVDLDYIGEPPSPLHLSVSLPSLECS